MTQEKVCPHCHGTRNVIIDDMTMRECICVWARAMRAHMGSSIAAAPTIESSPLYDGPEKDLTQTDVFIHGWWDDVLSHIKLVLIHKDLKFKYCIETDEKLRDVYLGLDAYQNKAKHVREAVDCHNSLHDLIGPRHQLAIIRLGFLGYVNKAMPGILKEALMLRRSYNLATWVVEEPHSIFDSRHRSWSEEVQAYITENFEDIRIEGRDRQLPERGTITSTLEVPEFNVEMVPVKRNSSGATRQASPVNSLLDQMTSPSKPKRRKY